MSSRLKYFKDYNKKRKLKTRDYNRKQYKKHKEKVLTRSNKRYILKKNEILEKKKLRDTSLLGHAYCIYRCCHKYAHKWSIPVAEWMSDLRACVINDSTYETLYKQWKAGGFQPAETPVMMRIVKKNGFVRDNIKWDIKQSYSWWNEDAELLKMLQQEIYVEQKKSRLGTSEEDTDDLRKQAKTKRLRK